MKKIKVKILMAIMAITTVSAVVLGALCIVDTITLNPLLLLIPVVVAAACGLMEAKWS